MRNDIRAKIIIDKNVDVEGSSAIFKSYVNKELLGQWLLESYLAQRFTTDEQFNISKNGKHRAFFNDSKDEEVGYLSDIYGYVGVLSIAARMGVKLSTEQKEDIQDNVTLILDAIDENGYTLYPYITEAENKTEDGKLFSKKTPYVGAMTWALSFFTSVRSAAVLASGSVPPKRRAVLNDPSVHNPMKMPRQMIFPIRPSAKKLSSGRRGGFFMADFSRYDPV